MGKRPATETAGAAAWKKFRGAGVKSKLNTIVSALRDMSLECQGVPHTTRMMLADGAPGALQTVAENRHKLQIELGSLISDTLQNISTRLAQKQQAAEEEQAQLISEREQKKVELKGAEDKVSEARSAVDQRADELKGAKEVLRPRQQALEESQRDVASQQRRRKDVLKEQAKFRDIMDNMFKVLLEGREEKNPKKLCDKLMKQLSALGAEGALAAAGPSVLLKKPEERQGFDSHVTESIRGLLENRLDAVQKNIDVLDAEEKAKEPELAAKAEDVAQAEKSCASLKEQLEALEEVACEKEVALAKVKTFLEAFEVTLQEKAKKVEAATAELRLFQEVLQIFQDLEDRHAVQVAPEEGVA